MTTINGRLRPISVGDRSVAADVPAAEKADPANPDAAATGQNTAVTLLSPRGRMTAPTASAKTARRVLAPLLVALAMLTPSYIVSAADAAGTSGSAGASAGWTLRDPFSREVVRRGDVDVDPYNIAHVREVQYRLKRLGLFDVAPTGKFGSVTEAGVKKFQKRQGLKVTGVVNYPTWRLLIPKTVRGKGSVPDRCKKAGWQVCYDRGLHQANLYHDGILLNSWMVRGGAADTPTRLGTYQVYYRDIDHTSSEFDDAPMPYSQFFDKGQALHGSRMMMDPYVGHSHGCVNFYTEDAHQLWNLTSTKTLWVTVYGPWS